MSVLVYTENWDGRFKKQTFEIVSYAASIAEQLGSSLTAVSIGDLGEDDLQGLGNYGASRVLSVRLKAGVGSGVSKLPVSLDPFTVVKRAYSGNAFAKLVIKSDIKIITLAQNSFDVKETGAKAIVENFDPGVSYDPLTIVKDVQKQEGKLLLTDAEIVVSGGRGMKSADNWGPLEELAEVLGAATACSRPVSDEGWRPHEEHTGQTGKIIAPNLYIAAGISGATQHIAGVSSSKYIVAINTDKDAPIFETAQYGIVGDASKVLPELVAAVKSVKNK
jgi:electron transfer flavoprotein alpha subunit